MLAAESAKVLLSSGGGLTCSVLLRPPPFLDTRILRAIASRRTAVGIGERCANCARRRLPVVRRCAPASLLHFAFHSRSRAGRADS